MTKLRPHDALPGRRGARTAPSAKGARTPGPAKLRLWTTSAGIHAATYRIVESLEVIDLGKAELAHEEDRLRIKKLNPRIERFSDAGNCLCLLKDPRAARIVQEVHFHDHRPRYELQAWAIMPNQVHAVLPPIGGCPLSKIVQALKGVTSKEIGKLTGTARRRVRDDAHFERLVRYLEWNPVKAGLCWEPKGCRWSSASLDAKKRLEIVADQGSAHP